MQCDVCSAERPAWQFDCGAVAIDLGDEEYYLDNTEWALCDVCRESLDSGDFTRVRMMVRAYNTQVADSEELRSALADRGELVAAALRAEYLAGAPLVELA